MKNCCVFFILFLLIGPEILFLFLETASVVMGPFLTAQSASLYSDPVMNWCCDCQPYLTLCTICIRLFTLSSVSHVWHWLHNLHLTLYTVICQPCLTLTVRNLHQTLYTVSRVWHWIHNLHLTLYTVICQPCLTLTVHNLRLTLYTVMNWCWDCLPCPTLTVYPLSFRFVGRPGKYKTIFGARQEEVSVLLFLGCFGFGDHLFC